MKPGPRLLLIAACTAILAQAATGAADDAIAIAIYRWEHSPHGALLERILPPAVEPEQLPEPR
jgi:hypothetical protein